MSAMNDAIVIRTLEPVEARMASEVLAQGMRDNPLHIKALGDNPESREHSLAGVFRAFLFAEASKKGFVLGAFHGDALVGVCGMMRPGCCQLSPAEKLTLLPKLLRHCGFGGTGRLLSQFGNWSNHDPKAPHWHLGPVGIRRELQGRGIGSVLMKAFCELVDTDKMPAWLETDKEINVKFYRKFGFAVIAEDVVNGTPNWFMERKARR